MARPSGGGATAGGASRARRTCAAALGVLACLAAAALPARAASERLVGEALEAAIVGPALNLLTDEDQPGKVRYRPDGSAAIELPGRGLSDAGAWRIAGDLMCHRWRRHLGGEERCFVVERVGEGKFVTSDDYLLWY